MFNVPVSSNILIPLSAEYHFDLNVDMQSQKVIWSDGYVLYKNPIFNSIEDISINNKTYFVMTSAQNLKEFMVENSYNSFKIGAFVFLQFNQSNQFITAVGEDLFVTSTSSLSSGYFRISYNSDNTISLSKGSKYFTVQRVAPWNIQLFDKFDIDTYSQQKFKYYLYGNKIAISSLVNPVYAPTTVLQRYISYSPVNAQVRAVGVILDDDYSPENPYLLSIVGGGYNETITLSGFGPEHTWVRYFENLTDKSDNRTTNIDYAKSIPNLNFNYLVDCAYETKLSPEGKISINLMPLKNIETPNYEYTANPYFDEAGDILDVGYTKESLKRREYNRIFTGTNEFIGYTHPFLGYVSNTKALEFVPDMVTYFHYPSSAPVIPLSTAGLIQSGGVAGYCPYASDKIWKKQADYSKYVRWGDASVQMGTWLCAWLSGSSNVNTLPVWKDRWYNPGYIDSMQAFVAVSGSAIYDEDSSMTFDKGVYYKYFHVGNNTNTDVVNSLSGANDHLRLHYDVWTQDVLDTSTHENSGIIVGFDANSIGMTDVSLDHILETDNCLVLNGTNQFCQTPPSSSYGLTGSQTINFWAYADDWSNVNGSSMVNNGFRGGWDTRFNSGIFTPFFVVYDTTWGHLFFFNNDGKFYKNFLLPIVNGTFGSPTGLVIDNDLYAWCLDNGTKSLYKIDYTGNIVDNIKYDDSTDLTSLTLDSSGNVYVLDTSIGQVSAYNPNTLSIFNTITAGLSSKIETDVNDNLIFSNQDVFLDSLGNQWKLAATQLFKNDIMVLSGIYLLAINIDKFDNVWIVDGPNVKKYSNELQFLNSIELNNDQNVVYEFPSSSTINFIDREGEDLIVVVYETTAKVFIFDSNLNQIQHYNLENKVDLSKYSSYYSDLRTLGVGDFTGYGCDKKHNYWMYGGQPNIQVKAVFGDENNQETISLVHPCSALSNKDWHLFTLTFNYDTKALKFYVDTVLRDSHTFSVKTPLFYKNKNGLHIGANASTLDNLGTDLLTTNFYFEGKVDDVRIYDYELADFNLVYLYNDKLKYKTLEWNMPTGNKNYLEEIEFFFRHKLTGMKSPFYNIKIYGLSITDEDTRATIEAIIRNTVTKVSPSYSTLYKIVWVD